MFGIWYGKGPGVDRCSDVFKHANMAGTTPWRRDCGGRRRPCVQELTAAHQSDHIFKACGLPVFFRPRAGDPDLGIHVCHEPLSGVWAGMKTIQEIVESSATAMIDPSADPDPDRLPDAARRRAHPLARPRAGRRKARLFDYKWYAALAYIRANRLNYNVIDKARTTGFGMIASGKATTTRARPCSTGGLDDATCRQLGIRLHKVGVVWPLEAQITREFATGLRETWWSRKAPGHRIPAQGRAVQLAPDVRPNVLGKFNEVEGDHRAANGRAQPDRQHLLRANADLSPALIAAPSPSA